MFETSEARGFCHSIGTVLDTARKRGLKPSANRHARTETAPDGPRRRGATSWRVSFMEFRAANPLTLGAAIALGGRHHGAAVRLPEPTEGTTHRPYSGFARALEQHQGAVKVAAHRLRQS